MLQEVREIWRTTSVQNFEGQGGKSPAMHDSSKLMNDTTV